MVHHRVMVGVLSVLVLLSACGCFVSCMNHVDFFEDIPKHPLDVCRVRLKHANAPCVVVDLGFHKTGTTTIDAALQHLGYDVCAALRWISKFISNTGEMNMRMFRHFINSGKCNAYQDLPWFMLYKEFDQIYPRHAKYILTYRPTVDWMASVQHHFGGQASTAGRKAVYGEKYGKVDGNQQHYMDTYEAHNAAVLDFFKDRPDDLLVVNLTNGDLTWENLCPFLNIDGCGQGAIPAKNVQQISSKDIVKEERREDVARTGNVSSRREKKIHKAAAKAAQRKEKVAAQQLNGGVSFGGKFDGDVDFGGKIVAEGVPIAELLSEAVMEVEVEEAHDDSVRKHSVTSGIRN
eukprot:TRINITY_DN634_c1_g1_i1.p1 TRINITY_DN634_c1_g1~~TRINITY_DN634_c1_g1_i1.p1  ORF type:complete len:348 (+),score=54.67 TRINITY_DN634_c1_g1_i1:203-1246(+)